MRTASEFKLRVCKRNTIINHAIFLFFCRPILSFREVT